MEEQARLSECVELGALLAHYAGRAVPDRQAWQDRVMVLEGASPRHLTRLHGELLAYGWLEQNTGMTPTPRKGEVIGAYRVTAAGLRALKQVQEVGNA